MPSCTSIPAFHREHAEVLSRSRASFLAASKILDHDVAVGAISPSMDGEDAFHLSYYATQNLALASWIWLQKTDSSNTNLQPKSCTFKHNFQPLKPLRQWLDNLSVDDRIFAHKLCAMIPAQCPFERDINLFGKTLFHIPPLCKLNPLYNELVYLRFRAMSYLADDCGEDVSMYT